MLGNCLVSHLLVQTRIAFLVNFLVWEYLVPGVLSSLPLLTLFKHCTALVEDATVRDEFYLAIAH